MKLRPLALILAVGLVGCAADSSLQSPNVFSLLAGQWDEQDPGHCENPHVISFDDDKTTMFITYAGLGLMTDDDSQKELRYQIFDANESALRVQLENEPHLDIEGNPVVWHILLIDEKHTAGVEMTGRQVSVVTDFMVR